MEQSKRGDKDTIPQKKCKRTYMSKPQDNL